MKKTFYLIVTAFSLCSFQACVSVKDELFLQNIEVEGSPSQPPLHITSVARKEGSLVVSPHVSMASGEITGTLEPQYDRPVPDTLPDFQRDGLMWNLPRFTFGADLDYAVSNTLALNAGISSSLSGRRQLTSYYAGLGLFGGDSSSATRLDLGVQFIDIQYRGATVILRTVGSGPQETIYYLDRGKEFQFNIYVNLTLNSTNPHNLVNWFLQAGISPQSLTSFVPRKDATSDEPGVYVVSDQRAESSVFWIQATPGIFLNLASNRRLVIGARLMRDLSSDNPKPAVVIMPIIKFDWTL